MVVAFALVLQTGAAAVMIVPPFYDALPWRELLAHYTAVQRAISIPIMYYNLPSATGAAGPRVLGKGTPA